MDDIQTIESFSQDDGYWVFASQVFDHMKNFGIHSRCLMHKEKPYKNAKIKGVEMMRMPYSSQRNIFLGKLLKNHRNIQLVGFTPPLGHR